jgi:hypothetical protein
MLSFQTSMSLQYQRFPNIFDHEHFCFQKITTDPHILAHIYMQGQDDRNGKLKTISQN